MVIGVVSRTTREGRRTDVLKVTKDQTVIRTAPSESSTSTSLVNLLLPDDALKHHPVNSRRCLEASFGHHQIDPMVMGAPQGVLHST